MTKRLSPEAKAESDRKRNDRLRNMASEGGLACKRKYGRAFYEKIGPMGYEAAKRRMGLTDAQMVKFLQFKSQPRQPQPGPFEPLQQAKLNAMPAEQRVVAYRRMREVDS